MAVQKEKLASEKEMLQFKTQEEMKVELVRGWMAAIGKGVIAPDTVMPIIQQLMPNVIIPIKVDNQQMEASIQASDQPQQEQQEQMQGQQELQGQEQPQEGMEQKMQPQGQQIKQPP